MVLSYPGWVLRSHRSKAQSLDQGLLGQSLLRKHIGGARRSLFALRRIEENELFDLLEFLEQLLDRQIRPPSFGLLVHILQQGDTQHAVEGVDANLAVGPVIHGIPAQPLSIERVFRGLKDGQWLGWDPMYHWTDRKIRIRAVYCILGISLFQYVHQ